MLVLTRKLQEQIRIGENITITILRVKGNTVRVGIDAPRQIRVLRGELPPEDNSSPPLLSRIEIVSQSADEASPSTDDGTATEDPAVGPLSAFRREVFLAASAATNVQTV